MSQLLRNKTVILGVTGSIACYKSLELASRLTQQGANVYTLMSRGAINFVKPLSFEGITNKPVITDIFGSEPGLSLQHITLARDADIVVVAPSTAHVIAKIAAGLADDVLTNTILATKAPIVLAPAMDGYMYENPATQSNIATLESRGFVIVGPNNGRLASGMVGPGRMVEPSDILGSINHVLGSNGDFSGKTLIISAGGTQEPIDMVRRITNRSSGKMGYAIAEAARDRGAHVVLISAPTALTPPVGVEIRHVVTAEEMFEVIEHSVRGADVLIMAAAVADYRPTKPVDGKIKKKQEKLTLELTKNPDILAEAKGDFLRVGFAAESKELLGNAHSKLAGKNLDLIVANDISDEDIGFGSDKNKVTIIDRLGNVEDLPLMTKEEVGHNILDRILGLL